MTAVLQPCLWRKPELRPQAVDAVGGVCLNLAVGKGFEPLGGGESTAPPIVNRGRSITPATHQARVSRLGMVPWTRLPFVS